MEQLFVAGMKSPYLREIKTAIKALDKEISLFLEAEHKQLTIAALHLHKSGGKRLRPGLVYLGGMFGNYDRAKLTPMAMALEITHMATLVHDDVVDSALIRRNNPTVKAKWGNETSVYTGNYLLAKAMSLVARYHSKKINDTLANTALAMCHGEICQLRAKGGIETNVNYYLQRIKEKTALLLSASCEMGAYLCDASPEILTTLRDFGENLGMAFQITDDILDYSPEAEKFGKVLGGDIKEGTMTLPLIYTATRSADIDTLKSIFTKEQRDDTDVKIVLEIVKQAQGIEYSRSLAQLYTQKAQKCLDKLPPGDVKQAFSEIAASMLKRQI